MYEIIFIMILTSICCCLIGSLLVLRGLSMLADAISHSALFGIIVFFFLVYDTRSPLLFIGAGLSGLLTVIAIELLIKTKLVQEDSAIGIVFPFFFSMAVILVSKYAGKVHIDTNCILMGDVIWAPLNKLTYFGITAPAAYFQMGTLLFLVLFFIVFFYKEIKLVSFDPVYAEVRGFSTALIHYTIMFLSSFVAVYAFDNVGAVMVIAFMITPAAVAYMLSKHLYSMFIISSVFSTVVCIIGVKLAYVYNMNVTAVCAALACVTFFAIALIQPRGIIYRLLQQYKAYQSLNSDILLIHITDRIIHSKGKFDYTYTIAENKLQLLWRKSKLERSLEQLKKDKLIYIDKKTDLGLTEKGYEKYLFLLS